MPKPVLREAARGSFVEACTRVCVCVQAGSDHTNHRVFVERQRAHWDHTVNRLVHCDHTFRGGRDVASGAAAPFRAGALICRSTTGIRKGFTGADTPWDRAGARAYAWVHAIPRRYAHGVHMGFIYGFLL